MQDSSSGIYIIPRFGGTPRRLDAAQFLTWSPNGSKFATCNADSKEIRITDKTTGESTFISLNSSLCPPEDIDWSPNGKFLLLLTWSESHRFGIWTISIDGTVQHKVIVEDTDLYSPRWASGGDAIYYFKYAPPSEIQLWKIPVSKETGIPTQSPFYLFGGLDPKTVGFTIANDGKRLFYARNHEHANLWLAMVEGQGKNQTVKTKQLTTGTLFNLCPSISPDGKLIAFSRGRGKPFNIFVMPIESDSPRQITFFNSLNFFPAWAPDGNEIAFSSNQGGINTVWKVSAYGGSPQQFIESTLGDVFTCLTWSPMQNILYLSKEGSNFHVLNPSTKEVSLLLKGRSFVWESCAIYSVDGKKIALRGKRGSTPSGIWIISPEDDSEVVLMPGDFYPIGWSADGTRIYVSESMQGAIKILSVTAEKGETKTIFVQPFSFELGSPENYQLAMTPDARRFVFPVRKSQSDVWMIENFDPEFVR